MSTKWTNVRVFISSTFRDMHAERDHLVKVVFPTLRERLERHRIHLVDIDLRWGVTAEQAENDMVLDLCLEQIDGCRPFFVGILGQRYGWVPDEFPDPAVKKFGWIQGMTGKSITELEMLHGVLNNPAMDEHALFLFRQPNCLAEVPDDVRRDVYEDEHDEQLACIKERIRDYCAQHDVPLHEYSCRWDAATGRLAGLEQFGEYVEQELWDVIVREHPHITEETVPSAAAGTDDWLVAEQDYHERFVESRLRVYVGREQIHDRLTAYLEGDSTEPLLLVGGSGTGKSAILGKQWQDWQRSHPDSFLLPHFVGASPSSTNLRLVLRRFCLALRKRFSLTDREVPEEPEKLPGAFLEFLHVVPEGQRAVFLIDAINQMDESGRAQDMHWLPMALPPHVKIILSCIEEPNRPQCALVALRARETPEAVVEPLTNEERFEIVGAVPSLSAKTLDPEQIGLLLDNPATQNPLYLTVALEELRGFGSFEKVNEKIRSFPRIEGEAGITALFEQVIERLEQEISLDTVRRALCLIACSRMGLSEQELTDILSSRESDSAAVRDCWAEMQVMLRQLRPYLLRRSSYVDFYHRNLSKAVSGRYLSSRESQRRSHAELAAYFRGKGDPAGDSTWKGSCERALTELPLHLLHAHQHKGLRDLYGDLAYVGALCSVGETRLTADGEAEHQGIFHLVSNLSEAADCLKQRSGDLASQVDAQAQAMLAVLLKRVELIKQSPHAAAQEIANYLRIPSAPRLAAAIRKRALKHVRDGLVLKDIVGAVHPTGADSGHSSYVTAIAIPPTGTRFLSGGGDGQIGYWDINEPRPIWLIPAHKKQVTWVALSPDGSQALSAATDGSVHLWDVGRAVSRPLFTAGIEGQSRNVWPCASFCAFLNDGSAIVTRGGLCQRLELPSGRTIWQDREIFAGVRATCDYGVDFSYTSNLLAVGDNRQRIRVCSAETGTVLGIFDARIPLAGVALSDDGKRLLAASGQGDFKVFHASARASIGSTSTASLSCLCSAFKGNSFFAYDSSDALHRIEVGDKLQVQSVNCRSLEDFRDSHTRVMACLRDNNTLLLGQASGALILFEWSCQRIVRRWASAGPILKGSLFPGGGGAIATRGPRIAGQSVSGNAVELLTPAGSSKTIDATPHSAGISDVAVLGTRLALSVDRDGTAVVWRGTEPVTVHRLGSVELTSCAGCSDTSLGACGTDADYAVFLGQGSQVQKHPLPSGTHSQMPGICALAVAGKPMSVCAAIYSGEVCYSSASGQTWKKNPHALRATTVAVDRRCRLAATGDVMGGVLLWKCSEGDVLASLTLHRGEVTALCFDPDGTILYSAGSDGQIHAVDPREGKILTTSVLPAPVISVLAEANGCVWALDANGRIYRFVRKVPKMRRRLPWPFRSRVQ